MADGWPSASAGRWRGWKPNTPITWRGCAPPPTAYDGAPARRRRQPRRARLMDFELAEEHRMLKDLVANFVRDELMPLEAGVMAREAEGKGLGIGPDEHARLDQVAHEH